MLRRLSAEQPEGFAFTEANRKWAEAQIAKFPEGRQASALIPLLWRAQEQEGWLTRPAIEHVADMLGLAHIRALEVATFYFMFQLQPTGSVAHVQICGTTSCMICGAEDLIGVCREKIAAKPHMLSTDGKFSWEEVECLGACSNAPMAQIGKDYYEDLTVERLGEILDALARGEVPKPGPQNGRFASEPAGGATSLTSGTGERTEANASIELAQRIGDTVRRIDGTEVPLHTPWRKADEQVPSEKEESVGPSEMPGPGPTPGPRPSEGVPADDTGVTEQEASAEEAGHPATGEVAPSAPEGDVTGTTPPLLSEPREGGADDLTRLRGVGPQIQERLNALGIWHFDQVAAWTDGEIDWIEAQLAGPAGRARRDDWVGQAKALVSGSATER